MAVLQGKESFVPIVVYTVCSVNEPFGPGSGGDQAAMKRFIRRALVQLSARTLSAAISV